MAASTPIVLRCSNGSLTLTLDEHGVGGWCQVHLLGAGASRPLGAEGLKYIASRLSSFLEEPEGKTNLHWVFSLSELHTCVYGEHVADGAILHLQDADARMLAELVITRTEKAEWIGALSQCTKAVRD